MGWDGGGSETRGLEMGKAGEFPCWMDKGGCAGEIGSRISPLHDGYPSRLGLTVVHGQLA